MSPKLIIINTYTFVDSKRKQGASLFAAVIMLFPDLHLFCRCFCITNKIDRPRAVYFSSWITLDIMSVITAKTHKDQ